VSVETDLAWAAGFIDGEGCIHIERVKHKTRCDTYVLRLYIGNTNLESLDKIKHIFGCGSVRTRSYVEGHMKMWSYTVGNKKLIKVLESIKPYSVVKKSQIELGLQFAYTIKYGKNTDEYNNNRHSLYIKMKELKKER